MSVDTESQTTTVDATQTSAAPDSVDSSTTTTTESTGDVQGASINADGSIRNSEALREGSSTKPDTTSHTPQEGTVTAAPPAPAVNYQARLAEVEARYKALRSGYDQGQQQLKQFQGVDPKAVADWQKQQEAAKQAQLKIWHPKNAANGTFGQTRTKLDMYRSQIQAAKTPEERATIEATANTLFTPQERDNIREWEGHKAQRLDAIAADEDAWFMEKLEKLGMSKVTEHVQKFSQEQAAVHDVETWFTNPANAPIAQKYAAEMRQALTDNVPWPYVRQMAIDRFRLEGAQSREGAVDQKAAMAKAQLQAQKKNASITRDGKTTPKDTIARQVFAMAKEKKWPANDPRILTEITRLSKQQ